MAVDLLGPASDAAVTTRPARTVSRGATDTWFHDCSTPDADDGTAYTADFFNDNLAQLRTALRSSAIAIDGGDDMLWRAMQSVGVRYGVDTGAANAITVAFSPVVPALSDGLLLLVKLAHDVTGATTVTADANSAANLTWPDGTAIALGDAKAGSLLLIGCVGGAFQLLCRMNGGGAGGTGNFIPGVIYDWPTDTAPTGTLECDGSEVSRTTYARLFGIIGSTYGVGNGTTTFNLPDRRGYFVRGRNHGAGIDPDAGSRTNRGDGTTGDHVGTKEAAAAGPISIAGGAIEIENPLIQTGATIGRSGASGSGSPVGGYSGGNDDPSPQWSVITGNVNLTGNSGSTETRPINVSTLFVIAY